VKPELFQGIFVKITLHANKHLIIGNIYRPPTSPKLESVKNLLAMVSLLGDSREIILLGDINLNWKDSSTFKERSMG